MDLLVFERFLWLKIFQRSEASELSGLSGFSDVMIGLICVQIVKIVLLEAPFSFLGAQDGCRKLK